MVGECNDLQPIDYCDRVPSGQFGATCAVADPELNVTQGTMKEKGIMTSEYLAFIAFDLGDTMMIEETEHKDADGETLRAELIVGMAEWIRDLKAQGILLGLIADTKVGTYQNVLRQHGLWHCFQVFSISDELGVSKPHPKMFDHARSVASQLGAPTDYLLMVGNDYQRDIVGAKRSGYDACWFHWNDRDRALEEALAADGIVKSATELRQWTEVVTAFDKSTMMFNSMV